MARRFLLRALYACGDWNHREELLAVLKEDPDGEMLRLLAVYYPGIASEIAIELLDDTATKRWGLPKQAFLVKTAVQLLEELNHPQRADVYLRSFQSFPAPVIAARLGELHVAAAAPLIRDALVKARGRSTPGSSFRAAQHYRYALAQLGDLDAFQEMLAEAKTISEAPHSDDRAMAAWQKQTGNAPSDFGLIGRHLMKLGRAEGLRMSVDLLCRAARSPGGTTLTTDVFFAARGDNVLEALEAYFSCNSAAERKADLTAAKRVLALFPDDPKARRLFETFVPDQEKRDDLLAIAREFGAAGLRPTQGLVTEVD